MRFSLVAVAGAALLSGWAAEAQPREPRVPIRAGYYVDVAERCSAAAGVLQYDGRGGLRWLYPDARQSRRMTIAGVGRDRLFYDLRFAGGGSMQIRPLRRGRIGQQENDYAEMRLCPVRSLPAAIRRQID